MGIKERRDRNRAAAYALTPYGDRIKDKFKAFLLKLALVGVVILVIVLVSVTHEPPQ